YPEGRATRPDGLQVVFTDGSWFVVRPSNTEPVVRIVAESADPAWPPRIAADLAARLSGRA
ncbi:MAG TPA: hypothetical protein VL172_08995, partial [Kofleriaceae bacterium]|nr:hypothetical protein [Kofleriaceae bacterium]